MSDPVLARIRRLWDAADDGRTNVLTANREVSTLARALEETDSVAYAEYLEMAEHRRTAAMRRWEAVADEQATDSRESETRSVADAAKRACRTLRDVYSDAAERRRACALARRWCIESGFWTIRDLTDTQSRILVELLRECLKSASRAASLTHSQLAKEAKCSVSSVKAAIRIFRERRLFGIRNTRLSARLSTPNLYIPCRSLVLALGPFVSSALSGTRRIGGQESDTLRKESNNLYPTVRPTKAADIGRRQNDEAGGRASGSMSVPGAGRKPKERLGKISCRFSAIGKKAAIEAIPLIDGKPISADPSDAEILARVDRIRDVLLPSLDPDAYRRAVSGRGEIAPLAILATVLKSETRSSDPIRKPHAYFLGTVWRKGGSDPAASLSEILDVHGEIDYAADIPAVFARKIAELERARAAKRPPPPDPSGRPATEVHHVV